jgi:adenine-specific DNA glycosylase
MQLTGTSLIEKMIAADVQFDAYDRLVPLLRQMNRTDEAATADYAWAQMHAVAAICRPSCSESPLRPPGTG